MSLLCKWGRNGGWAIVLHTGPVMRNFDFLCDHRTWLHFCAYISSSCAHSVRAVVIHTICLSCLSAYVSVAMIVQNKVVTEVRCGLFQYTCISFLAILKAHLIMCQLHVFFIRKVSDKENHVKMGGGGGEEDFLRDTKVKRITVMSRRILPLWYLLVIFALCVSIICHKHVQCLKRP